MKIFCQSYVNAYGESVSPGYITIANNRIASLKPFSDTPDLNLSHMTLLPGFVNAHCHLELTDMAPLPAKPFVEWVKQLISQQMAQTNPDSQHAATCGAKRLLQSGVTTIIDHLSPHTPLSIYNELAQRIVAIAEVLGTREEISKRNLSTQLTKQEKGVQKILSPHSVYGIHATVLKKLLQTTKHHSLHISESPDEQQYFQDKTGPLKDFINTLQGEHNNAGASPISTIQALDCQLSGSLIVHGNTLNDADLKTLQAWGNNVVVHCPGSFAYFGYSEFPLENILAHGIPVALGTDSLASNDDLNFLREIQLFLKSFPTITLAELLPMITTNAVQALGLQNIGKIQEGYEADLVGFVAHDETPLTILQTRQGADFVMTGGIIQI